jgi:riboflavin transporter FmnP
MRGNRDYGRFDSVSLAGVAVFGALSAILAYFSQVLGLNFPIVPYLQFDFGEVAIVLALFVYGPVPALFSSFVEFVTLLAFGQNVPIGPVLKLFAMVSSVLGIWGGIAFGSKLRRLSIRGMIGWGATLGAAVRAAVMTVPNYYLLVFLYSVPALLGFLSGTFKLVGLNLTSDNALVLILGFTAVFNVLQLALVMVVSFLVLELPQVASVRTGGRAPWFVAMTARNTNGSVAPASGEAASARSE